MALAIDFLAMVDEWQSSLLYFAWTEVRVKAHQLWSYKIMLFDNGAKNLIHSHKWISFCKYIGREAVQNLKVWVSSQEEQFQDEYKKT